MNSRKLFQIIRQSNKFNRFFSQTTKITDKMANLSEPENFEQTKQKYLSLPGESLKEKVDSLSESDRLLVTNAMRKISKWHTGWSYSVGAIVATNIIGILEVANQTGSVLYTIGGAYVLCKLSASVFKFLNMCVADSMKEDFENVTTLSENVDVIRCLNIHMYKTWFGHEKKE